MAIILALGSPPASVTAAEAVKGDINATVANGYARLVFHLSHEVESEVKVSNNILIITFKEPVDVAVDKLAASAAGYATAARLDPDRKGVRIALSQKVTASTIAAGERLFVDLLPASWTGLPPGLPQDVVDELARRAREAEKIMRQRRALSQQGVSTSIRVRALSQPTFTRYVFELPDLIAVTSDRTGDTLSLAFDAMLNFDLGEARAASPAVVTGLTSEIDNDKAIVHFTLAGKTDVRSFREDNTYVVDVSLPEGRETRQENSLKAADLAALAAAAPERSKAPAIQAPETVPAQDNRIAVAPPAKPAATEPKAPPPAAAPAETAPPAEQAPSAAQPPNSAAPAVAAPVVPLPAPAVAARAPAEPSPRPAAPASAPADILAQIATPTDPTAPVAVQVMRNGDDVQLAFAFAEATPAAVFRRADALWLVFDTPSPITVAALNERGLPTIRNAFVGRSGDAAVVQIKLERPRLVGVKQAGHSWVITLADKLDPAPALALQRNIGTRPTVTIPFERPGRLHRFKDIEVGDTLLVVTANGPARGFPRPQDFVEFRALASYHGVVIQPWADDVSAELVTGKIVISRPSGLILSAAAGGRRGMAGPGMIDNQVWGFDRQANFVERKEALVAAAADAPESRRFGARLDLARFYLAREMYPEARAVLDVAVTDSPPSTEITGAIMLRGIADVMQDRPDDAMKSLANPAVSDQYEAPLWRALADARLGKWTAARQGFRTSSGVAGSLPLELQRNVLKTRIRAAIEVGDYTDASTQMNEFEVLGVPAQMQPTLTVLGGRIAEGLGHTNDAVTAYREAAASSDRPIAAQARLRELFLKRSLGQLTDADTIPELESLTTSWRGDETEIEAMRLLSHLYVVQGRHRDAFHLMRVALSAHRNSEVTRRIHDEALETFDSLFLAGKGDALPAIEALALFYDFRELTPVGRRGDEMIRRLADRLVSVELLDQAAELLQHQVDYRLQGAARAQIATRLAVVHLMNHKPDRALAVLRATRIAELPTELRNQRLMIEARALADGGRAPLALEIIANIAGPQAIRLRADIMWGAKQWRNAAEQLELLYGDRWKRFESLNDAERPDILRAAIGYALGEDTIGLERFRERYASKFAEGPDRRAFEVVTAPLGVSGTEFREIVRSISTVNSLDAFLGDLRGQSASNVPVSATPVSQ